MKHMILFAFILIAKLSASEIELAEPECGQFNEGWNFHMQSDGAVTMDPEEWTEENCLALCLENNAWACTMRSMSHPNPTSFACYWKSGNGNGLFVTPVNANELAEGKIKRFTWYRCPETDAQTAMPTALSTTVATTTSVETTTTNAPTVATTNVQNTMGQWIVGDVRESCDSACARHGRVCEPHYLHSESEFVAIIAALGYECDSISEGGGWLHPSYYPTLGMCVWHATPSSNFCSLKSSLEPGHPQESGRFCYCSPPDDTTTQVPVEPTAISTTAVQTATPAETLCGEWLDNYSFNHHADVILTMSQEEFSREKCLALCLEAGATTCATRVDKDVHANSQFICYWSITTHSYGEPKPQEHEYRKFDAYWFCPTTSVPATTAVPTTTMETTTTNAPTVATASVQNTTGQWIVGDVRESCDSACARHGRVCDPQPHYLHSEAEFVAIIAALGYECDSISEGGGWLNPTYYPTLGMCFWRAKASSLPSDFCSLVPSTSLEPDHPQESGRFCYCSPPDDTTTQVPVEPTAISTTAVQTATLAETRLTSCDCPSDYNYMGIDTACMHKTDLGYGFPYCHPGPCYGEEELCEKPHPGLSTTTTTSSTTEVRNSTCASNIFIATSECLSDAQCQEICTHDDGHLCPSGACACVEWQEYGASCCGGTCHSDYDQLWRANYHSNYQFFFDDRAPIQWDRTVEGCKQICLDVGENCEAFTVGDEDRCDIISGFQYMEPAARCETCFVKSIKH